MPVLGLGVSYRAAGVELLERLSFPDDDWAKAYRRLSDLPSVSEAVVLSTCNRVEVYAAVDGFHHGFQDLKRFLSEASDVEVDELSVPLYSHYEDAAAEHLFSVAAGLDSMVIGEPQILAQVRSALRTAEEEDVVGPDLGELFQRAVRAGRRARAETAVGASPAAFVDAGIELAERHLGSISGRRAVVVGAGEMGALAAHALGARGVAHLVVLGRRPERAGRLAERVGGTAGTLADLEAALRDADVVVSSTGAAAPVIGPDLLRGGTPERSVFLVDLAVPRDVDPSVRDIPGVGLADIDDLRPVVGERRGDVDEEIARARAIVDEEARRYALARRTRRLAPLIQALHSHAEDVRADEVRRIEGRLAAMSPRDREAVEALTRRLVARLLHEPTVRLKDLTGRGVGEAQARALAELFGLDLEG